MEEIIYSAGMGGADALSFTSCLIMIFDGISLGSLRSFLG
jgi:hypothetical protein